MIRFTSFWTRLNNANAQFFAAIALKNMLGDHWTKMSSEKRVDLRKYALKFLETHGPSLKRQVLNAVIMLLVKVVKISWFDDKSHKEIVNHTYAMFSLSITHCFIGILILEQVLTEMTYVNKGKTLIQNRRISVNFRDTSLLRVFEVTINLLRELQDKISGQQADNRDLLTQATYHCLSLAQK